MQSSPNNKRRSRVLAERIANFRQAPPQPREARASSVEGQPSKFWWQDSPAVGKSVAGSLHASKSASGTPLAVHIHEYSRGQGSSDIRNGPSSLSLRTDGADSAAAGPAVRVTVHEFEARHGLAPQGNEENFEPGSDSSHRPGGAIEALKRLAATNPKLYRALLHMQKDQHGRISAATLQQVQAAMDDASLASSRHPSAPPSHEPSAEGVYGPHHAEATDEEVRGSGDSQGGRRHRAAAVGRQPGGPGLQVPDDAASASPASLARSRVPQGEMPESPGAGGSREGAAAERREHDLGSRADEGLSAPGREGASVPLSPADPAAAAGPGSRGPSRPSSAEPGSREPSRSSSAGPTGQQQQQQRRPWLPAGWNPPRPGSPAARSSAGASPQSRDASPRVSPPRSRRASPAGARPQPAGRQPHSPRSSNASPQTGQGSPQRRPHSFRASTASPQNQPAALPLSRLQSSLHRAHSPSGPPSRAGGPVGRGQPEVAAGGKGSVGALSPLRLVRTSPERLAKGSPSPERLTDSRAGAAQEHSAAGRQQPPTKSPRGAAGAAAAASGGQRAASAAGRTAASTPTGSPLKACSSPSTPSSSPQQGQQLRAGVGRDAAVHSSLGALPRPGSIALAGSGVRHSATAVLQPGMHDGGSMGEHMSPTAVGARLMVKADPALRPVVWEDATPGSVASSPGTASSSPVRPRAVDHGQIFRRGGHAADRAAAAGLQGGLQLPQLPRHAAVGAHEAVQQSPGLQAADSMAEGAGQPAAQLLSPEAAVPPEEGPFSDACSSLAGEAVAEAAEEQAEAPAQLQGSGGAASEAPADGAQSHGASEPDRQQRGGSAAASSAGAAGQSLAQQSPAALPQAEGQSLQQQELGQQAAAGSAPAGVAQADGASPAQVVLPSGSVGVEQGAASSTVPAQAAEMQLGELQRPAHALPASTEQQASPQGSPPAAVGPQPASSPQHQHGLAGQSSAAASTRLQPDASGRRTSAQAAAGPSLEHLRTVYDEIASTRQGSRRQPEEGDAEAAGRQQANSSMLSSQGSSSRGQAADAAAAEQPQQPVLEPMRSAPLQPERSLTAAAAAPQGGGGPQQAAAAQPAEVLEAADKAAAHLPGPEAPGTGVGQPQAGAEASREAAMQQASPASAGVSREELQAVLGAALQAVQQQVSGQLQKLAFSNQRLLEAIAQQQPAQAETVQPAAQAPPVEVETAATQGGSFLGRDLLAQLAELGMDAARLERQHPAAVEQADLQQEDSDEGWPAVASLTGMHVDDVTRTAQMITRQLDRALRNLLMRTEPNSPRADAATAGSELRRPSVAAAGVGAGDRSSSGAAAGLSQAAAPSEAAPSDGQSAGAVSAAAPSAPPLLALGMPVLPFWGQGSPGSLGLPHSGWPQYPGMAQAAPEQAAQGQAAAGGGTQGAGQDDVAPAAAAVAASQELPPPSRHGSLPVAGRRSRSAQEPAQIWVRPGSDKETPGSAVEASAGDSRQAQQGAGSRQRGSGPGSSSGAADAAGVLPQYRPATRLARQLSAAGSLDEVLAWQRGAQQARRPPGAGQAPAGYWEPDRDVPGYGDMAPDMAPQQRWPSGRHRPGKADAYRPQAPFQHQDDLQQRCAPGSDLLPPAGAVLVGPSATQSWLPASQHRQGRPSWDRHQYQHPREPPQMPARQAPAAWDGGRPQMPPWQAAAAGDAGLYQAPPHHAPAAWEGRQYGRQHLAQPRDRHGGRLQQQAGWQSPAGMEQQWQGSGQRWAPPSPGPEHHQPGAVTPSRAQEAPAAAVLHQGSRQPDRRLAAAYSAGSGWQSAAGGQAGTGPAGNQAEGQGDAGAQVPSVQLGRVHSGAAPGQAGSSAAAGTGGLPLGHMADQQQWQRQGYPSSELPVGDTATGMLRGGSFGRMSQDAGLGSRASALPLQLQMMPPPAIQQQQLAAAGAQVQAAAMSSLLLSGQAGQVTDPYNNVADGLQLPQYQAGLQMGGPQLTQAPLPPVQGGVVQQSDLQQPAAGLQPAWGQPGLHTLVGASGADSSQPGSLGLSAPLEQASWSATGAGQPQGHMQPLMASTLTSNWLPAAGGMQQSQMGLSAMQQSTGQPPDRQFGAGFNAPVFSTQQFAMPPGLGQPFGQPWQAAGDLQALQSTPPATSALEQLLLHGQGSVSAASQLQQQPSAPPLVT